MAFRQLVETVPFYRGLTLETIGGRGVRWPERDEARELGGDSLSEGASPATAPPARERPETAPPDTAEGASARTPEDHSNGALRLGTYRPIWAAPEVELSPALHYTIARQQVELSPQDAHRLGIAGGERVVVSQNGAQLHATAHVRTGVPAGTAFLADGLASDSVNAFTGPTITLAKAEGGRKSDTMRRFSDQPPASDGGEGLEPSETRDGEAA